MEFDPFENDIGHWGASLATMRELILPLLDAAEARSVVEVGAYAGDITRLLLQWAEEHDNTIIAIDPMPEAGLVELAASRPDLDLIRKPSVDALREVPLPDAAIIDGDHNWYTVTEELRTLAERSGDGELPLLLFHDVCWPHARRDTYYTPEAIPPEHRRDMVEGAGLFPGEPGLYPGGLPYPYAAASEGGPQNGVLTAIEDFVTSREDLRLAVLPAFFGLGVAWRSDAPYAEAIERIVAPFNRHAVLERLEANRVFHLATSHYWIKDAHAARAKLGRQEELLQHLLRSRAFKLAERLSKFRQGGEPAFSREDVRRVLAD